MAAGRAVRVRVLEARAETPDAVSFVLEPVDPDVVLSYRPGQFLTVRVPSDQTEWAARSYSLSSSPTRDEAATITVKRTAEGYVSNWMCDRVVAGAELDVLPPGGVFTPRSLDQDLLLVAAGSGVTPVMSILKAALDQGSGHVLLLYANRDEGSVIFAEELARLRATHPSRVTVVHWLESLLGLPDAAGLSGMLSPGAGREAFICGPAPFMDAVRSALVDLGTAPRDIHIEAFVSLTGDPFAVEPENEGPDVGGPSVHAEVEIDGEHHELAWPASTPLLDVLLAAGIDAPFSCREGSCSACACLVLEGEVELARNEVLEAADLADGIILACQATPLTDVVRVTYDT